MNKKKILTYIASALIPVLIFIIASWITGYIPFGDNLLNQFDSYEQYPGMLLEYANLLKNGNLFYSWGGGLGFNFYGALTYYGMSPLNLTVLFATPKNYHIYFMIMTYIRFALLGLTMCFYLDKKKYTPLTCILFSTAYSLMGFTVCFYYNYLWVDSIIMLPLVIHGLDKLIDENKSILYTFTLASTIIINYYIGYMICIFSLIWFIYRIISAKKKKEKIINFIISSIFAGLMSTIVILPAFYALKTGKVELYNLINYHGISNNTFTIFYMLNTGSYINGAHINGQAQIYSSLLTVVLTIFFFKNKKITKKEKIATLIVLLFYYASFSINFLNYAWQFFQKPIWWPSRFSFTLSFFLIAISARTLENIKHTDFKLSGRVISIIILFILILIGDIIKRGSLENAFKTTSVYLLLGLIIMIVYALILDRKKVGPILVILTLLDISMNTFNSLFNTQWGVTESDKIDIKNGVVESLKTIDENTFYRFETETPYIANDGLYFGYNGIDYFNSSRNMNTVKLFKNLGVMTYADCYVTHELFDPVLYSIFNVKYLYSSDNEFMVEVGEHLYQNRYPLSIGFTVDKSIKDFKLSEDYIENRNNLINTMLNEDLNIYEKIEKDKYDKNTYTFKSKKDYMIIAADRTKITINDEEYTQDNKGYKYITKNDRVSITLNNNKDTIYLLNMDKYEEAFSKLSNNLLIAKTNINNHILEGSINLDKDSYLFTSIEYEDGMKIYVDGKQTKPDIIMDTLIGLDLKEGEHKIVIDYTPKGFILGSMTSLTSLVVYLSIIIIKHRKTGI